MDLIIFSYKCQTYCKRQNNKFNNCLILNLVFVYYFLMMLTHKMPGAPASVRPGQCQSRQSSVLFVAQGPPVASAVCIQQRLKTISRASRQYPKYAAHRESAPSTVSTSTHRCSQAFSRAKGQYLPPAVASYLSLVHLARLSPSRTGPGCRLSESTAS